MESDQLTYPQLLLALGTGRRPSNACEGPTDDSHVVVFPEGLTMILNSAWGKLFGSAIEYSSTRSFIKDVRSCLIFFGGIGMALNRS